MATADPSTNKDVFQVRAELYAPSRLPPKAFELYRSRALVTDVVAQQCWLVVVAVTRLHLDLQLIRGGDGGVPRVGVIGGGHMGCAVAMALLTHEYPPDRIVVSTRQPERLPKCDALATSANQSRFLQLTRVYDNARVGRESDVLVLCVPPSQLKSVAIQIKHAVAHSACVVVSTLAGTSVETLAKACGTKLVVRTCVDVLKLSAALARYDDDDTQPDDTEAATATSSDTDHALVALRQRAESLAAEHLTNQLEGVGTPRPLAWVLTELAQRLHPSLSVASVDQAVAAVLSRTGDDVSPPRSHLNSIPADERTPEPAQDPDQEQLHSHESFSGGSQHDADEAEPHWRPAWTRSLQHLQAVGSQLNELKYDNEVVY